MTTPTKTETTKTLIARAILDWNRRQYTRAALQALSDAGLIHFPGCWWVVSDAGRRAGLR